MGADGLTVVTNGYGIDVTDPQNQIGGSAPGARNVISGNHIACAVGSGNAVQGNFIGTDASGTLPRGNFYGIHLAESANCLIGGTNAGEGNVISANDSGLVIQGVTATNNLVAGNLIGTDVYGTNALGNITYGVAISGPGNTIGGDTPGSRNVISANTYNVGLVSTANNAVQGNFVGTDITGQKALGTGTYGVYVESTTGTLIGGTTPGARNLASGNLHGIAIISGSSNIVQGNFVGTDASGLKALGNDHYGIYIGPDAPGSLIGGTSPGAGNLVSANGYDGLQIRAPGILIQGNTIGTDLTGTNDLFNGQNAILINDTAPFCQVGGTNAAARNIASGNNGIGVLSSSNVIQGNYVGVGADGRTIVGAPAFGIATGGLATGNLLGGDKVGAGNVVAGQFGDGIRIAGSNQVVQGNFIGTDATGTLPRPNHINGTIFGNNNLIGGLTPGAGNLISGNGSTGLDISDTAATGNTIQGNFIGTDLTGTNALPNGNTGLSIEYAAGNLIGGTSPGSRNVISGNGGYGLGIVYDSASNNVVQGNYVGLAADGATALPNFAGLRTVNAHDNLIGGTVAGARNIIAH